MGRNKVHKGGERIFGKLTFAEQARSITAMINNLQRSVRAHVRKARAEGRDAEAVFQKCVDQINRLPKRLKNRRATR